MAPITRSRRPVRTGRQACRGRPAASARRGYRGPQACAADGPVGLTRRKALLDIDCLVRPVKRADAEMDDADPRRGTVIGRAAYFRGERGEGGARQSVQGECSAAALKHSVRGICRAVNPFPPGSPRDAGLSSCRSGLGCVKRLTHSNENLIQDRSKLRLGRFPNKERGGGPPTEHGIGVEENSSYVHELRPTIKIAVIATARLLSMERLDLAMGQRLPDRSPRSSNSSQN